MATAFRMATLGLAAIALMGCDTIGNPIDALAKKKPAPDEFQVLARKELRMPPGSQSGAQLPVPQPGMPSPLEPDPEGDARAALAAGAAGTSGAAGAANLPGDTATIGQPVAGTTRVSRGEAALLQAADAASASPNIRAQLSEEIEAGDTSPYEPPTVAELLGFGPEDEVDPDLVLDPVRESQRLQTAGIRAPNDPDATPVDPNAPGVVRREASTSLNYPSEGGRPPRNTFDNTNTRESDVAQEGFVITSRPSASAAGGEAAAE